MSGYAGGGQIRKVICPCGWKTEGIIREANGKFKIHLKRCDKGKPIPRDLPFNTFNNSPCGLGISRNGNPIAGSTHVSHIIVDGEGVKIGLPESELDKIIDMKFKK
jgi:hypothetical protein